MQDRDLGATTSPPPSPNLLEFLGWVASRPRTYSDPMEAWRTSCPRLSVWEDATAEDLVLVEHTGAARGQRRVRLTARGEDLLRRAAPASAACVTATEARSDRS